VGAAQWLAGPAQAHGLHVDLREAHRLSRKIWPLQFEVAWLQYLSRPGAAPAPGAPLIAPADAARELPALAAELEMLRAKRRAADQRYDPRAAIFAQTRYLTALYSRLPAPDWLYQAYHGGEAGAVRLLRAYLGTAWPGSPALAIRAGRHGRPLGFEDLYFTTRPRSHRDAFLYLYGRGDDHRHYWWKVGAAREALAAYRADPAQFHAEWESLLPGRPMDAVWYPDGPSQALPDPDAVRAARRDGSIVAVPADPNLVLRPSRSDPSNSGLYAALRPESLGALLLISAALRCEGAVDPLRTGDLTLPRTYLDQERRLHPPRTSLRPLLPPDPDLDALPGGGPPADFDFHTTGLAFDLLRPQRPTDARILAYVLDTLEARGVLSWMEARDRGERRLHVVPSPRYRVPLTRVCTPVQATEAWRISVGTQRLADRPPGPHRLR
jgi:hypothetical protein